MTMVLREILGRVWDPPSTIGTVTLLAFLFASAGIPLQPQNQPKAGCQCDPALKAAGQCCCSMGAMANSGGASCCSIAKVAEEESCCSQQVVETKSCCSSTAASPGKNDATEGSPDSNRLVITGCGCGDPAQSGLSPNGQARILAPGLTGRLRPEGSRRRILLCVFALSYLAAPETPPPEVQQVDILFV